jgi:hypothetical protein
MARTLTRRRSARSTDAYSPADEPEDERYEEEEDERPARGSRRGSRRESLHTEEAPASRRSRRPSKDEDDEDDEPTPSVGGKGWGSYEKSKQANSSFPDDFKVTNEEVLLKFLDEEPFWVYLQHWIERKGKRSWTCLEVRCPLCDDAGDKPTQQVCFNVVDFTDPKDPKVKVWKVGPMVADILKNFAKNDKTKPINRDDLYFSARKESKNNKTNYYITPVKERDIYDDWDVDPDNVDLDALEDDAYDESVFKVNSRSELKQIAREILND